MGVSPVESDRVTGIPANIIYSGHRESTMSLDKSVLREAQSKISEAITMVEAVKDEAREAWDESSEKWQESDAGVLAEEKIAELEEIVENLNTADSSIESVMK